LGGHTVINRPIRILLNIWRNIVKTTIERRDLVRDKSSGNNAKSDAPNGAVESLRMTGRRYIVGISMHVASGGGSAVERPALISHSVRDTARRRIRDPQSRTSSKLKLRGILGARDEARESVRVQFQSVSAMRAIARIFPEIRLAISPRL